MPSPVTTDSKPPVQTSQTTGPAPAPAASVAPEVSDNLKFQAGVVVDPDSKTQTLADEIPEEIPALATPEDFKKKKKAVSEDSISYFELLLAQSKSNLESRKDSIEARQKSLSRMQQAQKESAKEMDKKVDEQSESQRKSAAKSGFLSIFSKVFTAITAVIGVAMLFIPGMQAFGVLMLVGAAVSIATQIPGVMEGLGKMFTAILTPLLGKELAEKWGPIVAAIYVAVVQIALAVSGPMTVSNIATGAMKAFAAVIKWTASVAGTVQGAVQGGVGIALGANNIDLAKITKSVDLLTSLNDLFGTQIQQYIETINQNYKQMTEDMRRSSQLVSDFPTFQVA
jgi:hypothetical protein